MKSAKGSKVGFFRWIKHFFVLFLVAVFVFCWLMVIGVWVSVGVVPPVTTYLKTNFESLKGLDSTFEKYDKLPNRTGKAGGKAIWRATNLSVGEKLFLGIYEYIRGIAIVILLVILLVIAALLKGRFTSPYEIGRIEWEDEEGENQK